ncbi:MAG: N-acetylglucosamine-6-phosphate deacetylase [Spirochaetaceae bacterium]|jgi:N-acetylglucosamine-6-phosphate deacetylase|nr:N-acetylglucosamine-6-phosphate deacetylase [Spirochaetaceae bacterium]
MNRFLLRGADLFCDERTVYPGADLYIEEDKILSINHAPPWEKGSYTALELGGLKVFPGMIDIHIHGALGKDFTRDGQEAVDAVSHDVLKDGVTGYCASLTVLSHAKNLEVLQALGKAKTPSGGARFLGIHNEGPFISKEYKALMDERYIRKPDIREMEEMIRAAGGALSLMTYSPSYENSGELVRAGEKNRVKMMIGHSAATCAETVQALDQGAAGYTHFYNAMSPHHHRNEGVVTAGLTDPRGFAELIADTVHITGRVLGFTYKILTSRRIILVTDAMPGKSMPDGPFMFSGLGAVKKGSKAFVKDTGRIAGSVIGMNTALRNMSALSGAGDAELVEMACVNPARLLNRFEEIGSIAPGKKADIAVFNERYDPVLTMVNGKILWTVSRYDRYRQVP